MSTDSIRADQPAMPATPAAQAAAAQREHTWRSRPLDGPISALSLLRQSLLFAELSDIAYYVEPAVRALAAEIGLADVTYFDQDGAQAYMFANDFDAVIVCRGTEVHEWNDIKADLDALTAVTEAVGKVHRGFKSEVDHLWPHLEEALVANTKTLWFAGHSLGAAMALICAGRCKLAHINSEPAAAFTFGSPRVGDKRYVNHCQFPRFRWVNNNDVVTRVPPVWLGYRHTGRELYLDARGRLRRLTRWQRTKDRWRGTWRGMWEGRLDPLTDHAMRAYIEAIASAVAEEEAGKDVLGRTERLFHRAIRRLDVRRRGAAASR